MENKKEPEKKFTSPVTSLKKPDTINISNEFRDIFLSPSNNPELLDVPVITFRIIFKIIADLRNKTFSSDDKVKNNPRNLLQLSLFDEEYRSSNNTFTPFIYNVKELDQHRNHANIMKALWFLEEYKKGWYTQVNSKGKKITSLGGLISTPNISEGKVYFAVSSYWVEKIIDMYNYNDTLYDVLLELKEPKHLLFYLWILRLGENGTKVNFRTLTVTYKLNYNSARDLYINFLVPLKKKLNKISGLSFGAGVKGDYISIVKVPIVQVHNLKEETITNLMIRQKVKYIRERHKLDEESLSRLALYIATKERFEAVSEAYKDFVKSARRDKIKASDITGEDFKKEFNSLLSELKHTAIW